MGRSSIPPTIPYSHPPPPPPEAGPISASLHRRSLSQPAIFPVDSLPPLIPSPHRKTSTTSYGDSFQHRNIHRRSRNDLPPAVKPEPIVDRAEGALERKPANNVGDDLFDAFLNLDAFDVVISSDYLRDESESRGSGNSKNGTYSSESEAESCAIDCGLVGESAPPAKLSRHFRSISMDGLADRVNFCENSISVWASPGSKRSKSSECDSMDRTFSFEFGSVEFSGTELKRIMADKSLEEIALADPKRAKRIIANRHSAARSKERKVRYISELESRVQTLQAETTILSSQLAFLKGDSAGLATENSELKIRLQAMEQEAQLRDALNEALTAEVHRLRLAKAAGTPSYDLQAVAAAGYSCVAGHE